MMDNPTTPTRLKRRIGVTGADSWVASTVRLNSTVELIRVGQDTLALRTDGQTTYGGNRAYRALLCATAW